MTAEERAELKKKEIEEEFLRYKLARRAAALKEAAEKVDFWQRKFVIHGENICTKLILKAEKGESENAGGKQLDVEIKVAGKAREKFRQIDAEGMQAMASEIHSKVTVLFDNLIFFNVDK